MHILLVKEACGTSLSGSPMTLHCSRSGGVVGGHHTLYLAHLEGRIWRSGKAGSGSNEHLRGSGRRRVAPEPIPVHLLVPHQIAYVESIPIEGESIAWTGAVVLVR